MAATMIGAGIFGATGGFAHGLGTDTNVLLVWLFRGGLALTGVLSLDSLLISLRHLNQVHDGVPPTAFTPEPVRRRLAGMKQILLSVSHAGPSDSGVIIDSIDSLPLIID